MEKFSRYIISFCAFSSTAFGSTCGKEDFAAHYTKASAIFIGKATKVDYKNRSMAFKVLKTYKGTPDKEVNFVRSPFAIEMEIDLKKDYLIFQVRNSADICTGSKLKSEAGVELGLLDKVKPEMSESQVRELTRSEFEK